MTFTKQLLTLFLAATMLLVSCSDDNSVELIERDYSSGILISGEGSGAGTGSVSYISDDTTAKYQFIYLSANGEQLGTFLQSIAFNDDNAFIIVDNANTITVVDKTSFVKTGEIIDGLSKPRYMTIINNKGYVTNWGDAFDASDDFIAVVDLTTSEVESTISVGNGPEQIVANGDKLYVSHKGAFGTNNIISVIDVATNTVSEITVEDNPDELFFNDNGELIVLSEGRTIYSADWSSILGHTAAAIQTIDVGTNTIAKSLEFEEGEHPSLMTYENGKLFYYLSGSVYAMEVGATELPTTELLTQTLYGMAVKDGSLYGVDADFSAQSDYYVFDIDTKEELYTTKVSLGASKIYFVE